MRRFLLFCIVFFSSSIAARGAEEENAFIVCENGLEMFQWDLDFIAEAQESIEISACYICGDILHTLLKALKERIEQVPTLQVYMLASPFLLEEEDKERLKHMQESYENNFHVLYYPSVLLLNAAMTHSEHHAKFFIVDEYYFSLGGTNLGEHLCTEGTFTPPEIQETENKGFAKITRDMDVVGRGPLAKQLRLAFYQFYALWEAYQESHDFIQDPEHFVFQNLYFPLKVSTPFVSSFETSSRLCLSSSVKCVFSGPMHSPNHITQEYAALIRAAKEEIIIGNLYFNPEAAVVDALMDAANRDVHLTVITNGITDISPSINRLFAWANRLQYVPLLYGKPFHWWERGKAEQAPLRKTKIYEYYVREAIYHKKVMIVDRRYFVIGSYNHGVKSATADYEVILVIDSPEIAQQALEVMQRDLLYSKEVLPQQALDWHFNFFTAHLGELQKKAHGIV